MIAQSGEVMLDKGMFDFLDIHKKDPTATRKLSGPLVTQTSCSLRMESNEGNGGVRRGVTADCER